MKYLLFASLALAVSGCAAPQTTAVAPVVVERQVVAAPVRATTVTRSAPVAARSTPATTRRASYRQYYTGARGGCYYVTGSGNRQYVDRSYCR